MEPDKIKHLALLYLQSSLIHYLECTNENCDWFWSLNTMFKELPHRNPKDFADELLSQVATIIKENKK